MSYWIAKNVVYCPRSSFKAFTAYNLFLTDFKSNDLHEVYFHQVNPSRASFYDSIRTNISKGLIRSSVEMSHLDIQSLSLSPKMVRKNSGVFFEGFRIERRFAGIKGLPPLINSEESSKLWNMIEATPVEDLFLSSENLFFEISKTPLYST